MSLSFPTFEDESIAVQEARSWFVTRHNNAEVLLHFLGGESFVVTKRLESRRVEAHQQGKLCLVTISILGECNAAEMALHGISAQVISHFYSGFPPHYLDLLLVIAPSESSPPSKRRRSLRNVIRQSFNEEDLLQRAGLGTTVDSPTMKKEKEQQPWTSQEIASLSQALVILDAHSQHAMWDTVSREFVPTRSPRSCQRQWTALTTTTTSKQVKSDFKPSKQGTAKFRQQVRKQWEDTTTTRRQSHPPLAALSTPYRNLIPALPSTLNCSLIVTPHQVNSNRTPTSSRRRRRGLYSNENEEHHPSPEILIPANRDKVDHYVTNLLKLQRKGRGTARRVVTTVVNQQQHVQAEPRVVHLPGGQGWVTPKGSVKIQCSTPVTEL